VLAKCEVCAILTVAVLIQCQSAMDGRTDSTIDVLLRVKTQLVTKEIAVRWIKMQFMIK